MSLFFCTPHFGVPFASYIPVDIYSFSACLKASLPTGAPFTSAARPFLRFSVLSGLLVWVNSLVCVSLAGVSAPALQVYHSFISAPLFRCGAWLVRPSTWLGDLGRHRRPPIVLSELLSDIRLDLTFVDLLGVALGIFIVRRGILNTLPVHLIVDLLRKSFFYSSPFGLITYKTVSWQRSTKVRC
jgi:hypothetical protein